LGFFGTFTYGQGNWAEGTPTADTYLTIDIHDSDIATVRYASTGEDASGEFYLGIHRHDYFADASAGVAVDVEREAAGLAAWAERVVGSCPDPTQIAALMPRGGSDEEPQFVFVEGAVQALQGKLGIPPPPGLPDG